MGAEGTRSQGVGRSPVFTALSAFAARPRAALVLVGLALSTWACRTRAIERLELADQPIDYAFVVTFDAAAAAVRVTPPFARDGAAGLPGGPALDLREDEIGWVVIGFERATLTAAVGGFEATRAQELALSIGQPPMTPIPERNLTDGDSTALAIPASAILFTGDGSGDGPRRVTAEALPVLRGLTLHVPFDPEYCRIPAQSPLRPFTDTRNVFAHLRAGSSGERSIAQLEWLDDTHVLALTATDLAVLELGAPLTDRRHVARLLPNGVSYLFDVRTIHLALDPTPLGDGRRHAVVVAGRVDETGGHTFDLTVSPAGVVVTASTTLDRHATGVAFDLDGSVVVTTDDGTLYRRARGAPSFAEDGRLTLYPSDNADAALLTATGNRTHPLLAVSRARTHVLDARAGRWSSTEVAQTGLLALELVDFHAVAAGPNAAGEAELLGGAQRGLLFRKLGGRAWERQEIALPPRLAPCATEDDQNHQLVFQDQFFDLALDPEYIHVAVELCDAVLQLRRDDLCPSVLATREDGAITEGEGLWTTLSRPGRLVVGGYDGLVLTSTWTPTR